ncbi:hypothetical protein HA402_004543 [Bradysia odoriphaga]|nr:hypothetical protein HA402_004543 [Bradysia odoriphaga]
MTEQQSELVKIQPKTECSANNRWFLSWLNWTGITSSGTMLRTAEKRILSFLKTAYRGFYVDIGPVVGEADKIWTISLNSESPKTPLVMLHGMGAGVAFWVLNLDSLAVHRPVYAIDILGFGRSSRPTFTQDAVIAEKQLVKSIEEWRREMNIQQMILLGHSMGGFLATSYTISYPDRVKHLILADPWGFQEKPKEIKAPLWIRAIGTMIAPLNPLWALRAAGPYGQWVVEKTRPDIIRKFTEVIEGDEENVNVVAQYIHQCNAQSPTGESAFHSMMHGFGWAKHPMLRRMHEVRHDKAITLLYGSRSWIDKSSWDLLKAARESNYVNVQVISGAGHHVFADKPELFNRFVNEACAYSDSDTFTLNSPNAAEPTDETTVDGEDINNGSGETNQPATNIVNDKNFVKTST